MGPAGFTRIIRSSQPLFRVVITMEQTQSPPVYWDKHRIPFNLTLAFSALVAAYGAYLFFAEGNKILIFAGLAVGAYSWFTNPKQYLIFPDRLHVVYGRPRVKIIYFSDISRLEMRALATPDRLRVWPKSGRRVVVMAKDVDAFYEKLDQALGDYRRLHPEDFYDDPPAPESAVVEGAIVEPPTVVSDLPPSDQSSGDKPQDQDNASPY